MCQTLLTSHGNPYSLGGMDRAGLRGGKVRIGGEVERKTVVGM